MTNEQIITKIKEQEQLIEDAEEAIKNLHNQLRANSPVQVGDGVRITTPAHKSKWGKCEMIPEEVKEVQCIELEIDNCKEYSDVLEQWVPGVKPIYHPITKAGRVSKVGRFYVNKEDIVEKI